MGINGPFLENSGAVEIGKLDLNSYNEDYVNKIEKEIYLRDNKERNLFFKSKNNKKIDYWNIKIMT